MDFVNIIPLFRRFTDRSRKVMRLAEEVAVQLHHDCIGTEHILLGLYREGSGVAANILKRRDFSEGEVLLNLRIGAASPGDEVTINDDGIQVVQLAIQEALDLGHNYVGTEHLLLAVLGQDSGIATSALASMAPLKDWRNDVYDLLGHPDRIE